MSQNLIELGWSAHFMQQLDEDALQSLRVGRVNAVHRSLISVISPHGPLDLTVPSHASTGAYAVGDWVLFDEAQRVTRLLDRKSVIERRAAGLDARAQIIAANLDVLFVVSSCNQDFKVARLERYLAVAQQAGVQPVVLLTKADLAEDVRAYEQQAQAVNPLLPVIALDGREEAQMPAVFDWWRAGQTAALVGSSGVGKTTLLNTLSGMDVKTSGIREDDAKGRHTTTSRALYRVGDGRWLIDTPGMRALRLYDVAEGVDAVFQDLVALADQCRFSDCNHESEPGCAVQAAIAAGELDADRLKRWRKLAREEQHNTQSIAESRARAKSFAKMVKRVKQGKIASRGDFVRS